MSLSLKAGSGEHLVEMSDNAQTLAHYGPQEFQYIHITDTSGTVVANEWDDVSKVEKYVMTDKDYDKRTDTFRNFVKEKRKTNPDFMKADGGSIYEDFQKEESEKITVGQRCQLTTGDRRGEVKYVGKVKELGAGYWVGVELDEPTGNCNGKAKGKQYFEVGPSFGIFVRPNECQVGDYPPIDDFDAELDEI